MGEGSVARATGRLAEPSDRLRSLREAVALLAGSGAQLEYARALVELGTAVRVAGRRVAARKQLQAGYELATRCTSARLATTHGASCWQPALDPAAKSSRESLP